MSHKNILRGRPDIRGVNIYTDGSKDGNRSGAGVVVMDGGQVRTDYNGTRQEYSYHLGENTTVFQTEVFAHKMAASLILNGSTGVGSWVNRPLTIYTDSQAAMLALNNVWVKSELVHETLDLLDRAADCCQGLTIRWVQAHKD